MRLRACPARPVGRVGVPWTTQVAAEWLDRRADEIDLSQATASPRVAPWSTAAVDESVEMTYLSVLDGGGNAVALTTTLNGASAIEESLSLGEVLAVTGAADGAMQAAADPRHPGPPAFCAPPPIEALPGHALLACGDARPPSCLDRDRGRDGWVRIVADDLEVLEGVVE